MQRRWAAFLLAAMVLTLVGCGREQKEKSEDKEQTPTTYTGPTDPTSPEEDKTEKEGDSAGTNTDLGTGTDTETREENTESGTTSPALSARGYAGAYGRSWQQMVDNGRVRDRDGDLRDGENSAW